MIRFLLRLPGVRHVHERQLLFPVLVLLVVAGVLAHGALDRSRAARAAREALDLAAAAPPEPPRPPASRLSFRGDLEKTPLTYFSDYWAQLASEVRPHIVTLADGHAGLVIEPGLAVTSAAAARATAAAEAREDLAMEALALLGAGGAGGPAAPDVTREPAAPALAGKAGDLDMAGDAAGPGEANAGGEPEVEFGVEEPAAGKRARSAVDAVDRVSGLALVTVPPDVPPFEMASARALPSGSYVGTVTLDASGASSIAPGYLVSAHAPATLVGAAGDARRKVDDDLVISTPLARGAVAAVVDLDGVLVGVTYPAPDGPRTLTVDTLRRLVDRMQRPEPCRAIAVSVPSAAVLELLQTEGLLVEHVVGEAFVPEPSIQPGDVLVEWDGEPVTSVEAFHASYDALEAGTLVRYRVVRGRRGAAGGTVMPDAECRAEEPPAVRLVRFGLVARWEVTDAADEPGWMVTTVVPGGPAHRAGLAEGDRLIAVDGRAVGDAGQRDALERLDARERPILIAARHQGRMKLAAITPPEP